MKTEYLMLHHLQKNGLGDFSVPVIVVKNDPMGNDFAEFLINEKNYECSEKAKRKCGDLQMNSRSMARKCS